MAAAYHGSFKVRIFVFILGMLAAGPVVAEENGASFSLTSATAEAGFNLDYGNDRMAGRAIDERIIHRFLSFEPSDDARSGRYSISWDLEREDSDWNFEVTVTMEF
jgi:hypothetical protein